MSVQEEFDSEWQKNVWDFAIISTHNSDTKFVMNGPIDYRYYLNYGVITMECFNCTSYSKYNEMSSCQYRINNCIQQTCKSIDCDTQYFWYTNHETWQFDNDFYPDLVEFYKHKPEQDARPSNQARLTEPAYRPQKEIYDIAMLTDKNRKYRKVLTGPIVYEAALKQLSFNECTRYIKGDIKVLRKYGNCVKKVAADKFFSILNENTRYGIQFDFDYKSLELWNFRHPNKQKWEHYKAEQQEEKYDVILITNEKKQLQYILSDGTMNCIEEVIKFTSFEPYQSGDHEKLNELAIKIKGFGIGSYRLWLEEGAGEDGHRALQRASFIGDALYETIKHRHFRFPDGMKPNKAFFYRFPDLKSKLAWKRCKNEKNGQYQVSLVMDQYENPHLLPMDPTKLLKNIRFEMDSNLQIIHNTMSSDVEREETEPDEEEKQHKVTVQSDTRSLFGDMNVLQLEQQQKQSVPSAAEIHPLKITTSSSNMIDGDDNISNLLSPNGITPSDDNSIYASNERKLTPQDLTTTNLKSKGAAFSFRATANSPRIRMKLDTSASMSASATPVSTSGATPIVSGSTPTPIQMDQSRSSLHRMSEVEAVLSPKASAVTPFSNSDASPLAPQKTHTPTVNSAQLRNSKYFTGMVKLPPLNTKKMTESTTTNQNEPDMEDEKKDENPHRQPDNPVLEVWDLYVKQYGFAPKNASQLHKFSRYSADTDQLKYVEAREQFVRRCRAQ